MNRSENSPNIIDSSDYLGKLFVEHKNEYQQFLFWIISHEVPVKLQVYLKEHVEDIIQIVFTDLMQKASVIDEQNFPPDYMFNQLKWAVFKFLEGGRHDAKKPTSAVRWQEEKPILEDDFLEKRLKEQRLSHLTEKYVVQGEKTLNSGIDREKLIGELAKKLKTLTTREENVLKMHFFEGMSYEEIAKHYGAPINASKAAVQRALRKLRHPSRSNDLRNYLET